MFSRLTILVLSTLLIFLVSCSDDDETVTGPTTIDTLAPAAVTNLTAGDQTGSSITLTWTAPGDDNWIAKAQVYDIRYSTSAITEDNWDAAIKVTDEPDPTVGGEDESYVVTGLDPTTTYYFALRTADEVPNWSGLSNVASLTTYLAGEWTVYTTANTALPTNAVGDISFNSRGHVFFATDAGLVNLEATDWNTWDSSDSTLISDDLTTVVVDNSDDVWIGFRFDGAALLSGETIVHFTDTNSGLSAGTIRDMVIADNGQVWFSTGGGGLFLLENDTWTHYNASNSDLSNNQLGGLGFDSEGNLWIGYNFGGVCKFDGVNFTDFDASHGFTDLGVSSIASEGDSLWFGTDAGVFLYDGSDWINYNTANSGLASNVVYALAVDSWGHKWFGTVAGLCRFDGTTWTTYRTSNSPLPDNTVQAIEPDALGNLWVGTSGGIGVFHD